MQGGVGQDLREGAEACLVLDVGLLRLAVGRPPVVFRQMQLWVGGVGVQRGDAAICARRDREGRELKRFQENIKTN